MRKIRSFLSKKLFGKLSVAALAILLALGITAGSIAYMFTNTDRVTNQFIPGKVTCYVDESFDGNTKSAVRIQNTGNVSAKIRVKVVVNWVDADGNICGYAHPDTPLPALGQGWSKSGDYYYYSEAVEPSAYTGNLFAEAIPMSTYTHDDEQNGCHLQIEIIASAIQAEGGADWGATPSGN